MISTLSQVFLPCRRVRIDQTLHNYESDKRLLGPSAKNITKNVKKIEEHGTRTHSLSFTTSNM
jgi:hypothetical protein